jgi:hypothetical protein
MDGDADEYNDHLTWSKVDRVTGGKSKEITYLVRR